MFLVLFVLFPHFVLTKIIKIALAVKNTPVGNSKATGFGATEVGGKQAIVPFFQKIMLFPRRGQYLFVCMYMCVFVCLCDCVFVCLCDCVFVYVCVLTLEAKEKHQGRYLLETKELLNFHKME